MAEEEAAILHTLLELLVVVALIDALITIAACLLEDVLLNVFQQLLHIVCDAFQGTSLLLKRIAAHELDGAILQVASTQHKAYGHTLQLIVGKLEARTLVIRVIELHADALCLERFHDGSHLFVDEFHLLGLCGDGDDDHLQRSKLRRQHQTIVVGVSHDECTDEACGNAP